MEPLSLSFSNIHFPNRCHANVKRNPVKHHELTVTILSICYSSDRSISYISLMIPRSDEGVMRGSSEEDMRKGQTDEQQEIGSKRTMGLTEYRS